VCLRSYPPFYDENTFIVYQKILSGTLEFPPHFSPAARDLVGKLLQADQSKRCGCMWNGVADIKNHKFFEEMDFGTRTSPLAPVVSRSPACSSSSKGGAKPGDFKLGTRIGDD
jgi:serine/threonine protein kinase